jgi:hypothetical protein
MWMINHSTTSFQATMQQTEAERETDMKALIAAHKNSGARPLLRCESSRANDAYLAFGVETFPSLEAFQAFKAELEKINWPSYVHGTSILGTLDLGPEQLKQLLS